MQNKPFKTECKEELKLSLTVLPVINICPSYCKYTCVMKIEGSFKVRECTVEAIKPLEVTKCTNRPKEGQIDREADRMTDGPNSTERGADRQRRTEWQTDRIRPKEGQIDRQTDRMTGGPTGNAQHAVNKSWLLAVRLSKVCTQNLYYGWYREQPKTRSEPNFASIFL